MDSQDHGKTSPSVQVSHGVHVCHKCGWPFPNPHPSAKQRRAHKKICGTIEGYKLIDSEEHTHLSVSDDEQVSDEDQRTPSPTPSPKNENRGIKGMGSGGVGERSNRLEDEVFSDAVADFPNSEYIQGLEEHLGGGRQLDKNMEKIMEGDCGSSQLLKVDATSGELLHRPNEVGLTVPNAIMPPLNKLENNSQMHNTEILERATNELGSTTMIQDIVSSCTIDSMVSSAADTRTEELAVGPSSTNGLACDLPPVKSETVPDVPKEYITANIAENEMKLSMTCDGQETDAKGNKENNLDKILSDDVSVLTNKTASEASKLTEMDGKTSDPVRADRIVESKEEQSERSGPNMLEYDLSPEVESVEQVEAFVNTVQVEADSAQDIDAGSRGCLVEVSDTKGEMNKDMHVLSVPSDMPIIGCSEIMIEDFKDHREVGSNLPLTLGPGEVIRSLEDDTKDTVYGESHSKLPEMDGKSTNPVRVDGIVESRDKQSEELGPMMSECDLSPEGECVEPMVAYVNPVQVKADSAQDIDVGSHGFLVEVSDTKGEGKEDIPLLSVANDMPIIDHPEIMIEDFKDRKAVELNLPLTPGPGQVSKSLEDDTKTTVYEESHSNSDSSNLGKINMSFADTDSLEEDGGKNHVIKEVPVEGDADTSEFQVSSGEKLGSSGLEAGLDTISTETEKDETNRHLKGLEPRFGNDLPQNTPPDYNSKDLSDVISIITSVDDGIDHSTNLSGNENVDNHEMDNIDKCDRAGNHSIEATAEDKISVSERMPPESADNLSVLKVDQIASVLEYGDTGDHEIAGMEFSDIARNESIEAVAEEKCAVKTKAILESACDVSESHVVVDDGFDKVVTNLLENDSPHLDRVLESSQVIGMSDVTQPHSSLQDCKDEDNNEVLPKCTGTINMVAVSNHDGDVELLKSSENFYLKKPGPLPVDSQIMANNSATVEDSHNRDCVRGVSGITSATLQEEGENLTKLPLGGSAVDISVDSWSQTDSLEGNWGSVSVLSTQSDAPAAIDAEALPSTDSQAPEQSEKSNLGKKTASEGHHSKKSDVFEHPSFMTLVESGGGADQKTTSEIQTVQNTEQPKPDALQAGWFPSLTNVVNESQGRKKNEEIIAKVTSWSTSKQHTPLKSLLGEASLETKPKSPNPKQSPTAIRKDEAAAINNGASATTVNSIPGPNTNEAVKRDTGKEWNSPARYPIDSKKEKRKVKGKPYWVPFACCSSVN